MGDINPEKSMDFQDYVKNNAPATSFTPGQNVNVNTDRSFAADPMNVMDDPDSFAEALVAGKIEDVRVEEMRAAQRRKPRTVSPQGGSTEQSRGPSNTAAAVAPVAGPGVIVQGLDLAAGVLHWKVHHVTMSPEERRQAQALVASILKRNMDDEINGLLHQLPEEEDADEPGSETEEMLDL